MTDGVSRVVALLHQIPCVLEMESSHSLRSLQQAALFLHLHYHPVDQHRPPRVLPPSAAPYFDWMLMDCKYILIKYIYLIFLSQLLINMHFFNRFIEQHHVSSHISAVFQRRADPSGYDWRHVSADTREFYFSEFQVNLLNIIYH